ncbi:MAG: VOC family protein [Mycobacteriales bacterium]
MSDLDRARTFYEGQLGGKGQETPGGWQVDVTDGSCVYLLQVDEDAGLASWPLASFRVDDVRARTRELRDRGVTFLGPDHVPYELDADGVKEDDRMEVSWMTDPDGNVLTLFRVYRLSL